MVTRRMQKFDFGSEKSAKAFAASLSSIDNKSEVKVSGSVVHWVECSTD